MKATVSESVESTVSEPVETTVSEPVELKVSGVMDMLEQEFQVLTAIEQGKIIGGGSGSGGDYGSGGGMGSGGPGCDPLSSTQLDFIKTAENYKDHVYDDGFGNLTAGYGHKLTSTEVEEYHNHTFDTSPAHLQALLQQDLANAESIVNSVITNPDISQNMYGAMVDLVFNSKVSDFIDSNMVKDVNEGHFIDAGLEFENWNL